MSNWITPANVSVGEKSAKDIKQWIANSNGNVAVITGSRGDEILEILGIPKNSNPSVLHLSQQGGEPELHQILKMVRKAKEHKVTSVVGIGGGSAMDAAKAIAALSVVSKDEDPLQYLEVIGEGKTLPHKALPVAAIPTTAGSGAEATKNAVILSKAHKVKVSLRHPSIVPSNVYLDPKLSLSMPSRVSASTGMDALTQLLEAYITKKRNPFTDGLCLQGLEMVSQSLTKVMETPNDLAKRQNMLIAAYFSGVALANSGLGAVHGFAGPMGGMFDVPHGEVCASLLPSVMEFNIKVIDSTDGAIKEDIKQRLTRIAALFLPSGETNFNLLPDFFYKLKEELQIRNIADMGVQKQDWPTLIEKSMNSSSMKGNPVILGPGQLESILLAS